MTTDTDKVAEQRNAMYKMVDLKSDMTALALARTVLGMHTFTDPETRVVTSQVFDTLGNLLYKLRDSYKAMDAEVRKAMDE